MTLAAADDAFGLAVDSTNVYWTSRGAVMSVAIGGGAPTTLAAEQQAPAGIVLDSTTVYWIASGVVSEPKIGGPAATLLSLGGLCNPPDTALGGIAVDDTNVYWTQSPHDNHNSCPGLVMSMPKDGGTTAAIVSGNFISVDEVVVDSTTVYFEANGALMSAPKSGTGSAVMLAPNAGGSLVADDANLYWTDGVQILAMPKGGGTPTVLVANQDAVQRIAVDATKVYWANVFGEPGNIGAILSSPLAGGNPTVLATGLNSPIGVAVDATSVYWTNNGGGEEGGSGVMRVTPK